MIFVVDTYILGKESVSLKVTVKGQEVGERSLNKKDSFVLFFFFCYLILVTQLV